MHAKTRPILISVLFVITLVGGTFIAMSQPQITQGETRVEYKQQEATKPSPLYPGKHVIVHLDTMELEMKDGATLLQKMHLISQGKPGSYYETIGGIYKNDYKIKLHFSSIGHVYMPYSVHLFGNYFIHGIPYYPDGTKVSSTYSGGCIRLSDVDAKTLYEFVERGTPIVIVRGDETSFTETAKATSTLSSQVMTDIMVAIISLEVLTQDNVITSIDQTSTTTRRSLLPLLLREQDTRVSRLYAGHLGEGTFTALMNEKAQALGLSSTRFTSVDEPTITSQEDYVRLMSYVTTYKSYLQKQVN